MRKFSEILKMLVGIVIIVGTNRIINGLQVFYELPQQ